MNDYNKKTGSANQKSRRRSVACRIAMQLGVQYLGPKGRDYYGGIVVGEGYEVMSNTNTKRV